MRRPLVIALVVMGGGALAAGTLLPNRSRECEQARAAGLPNAAEICARASASHGWSSSGTYHSGSGIRTTSASVRGFFSSGSGSGSVASAGSVSRGGFGGAGHGFFSFGGS